MAPRMPHPLLKHKNPPVIETVLGVQFAALPGWTTAHPGWFWKRYLDEQWSQAADAQPLMDQFELFGDERKWQPAPSIQFLSTPLTRLQITNTTGDRMVQIQPTRFIYNWQKRDSVYPSYGRLRSEFDALFATFNRFVVDAKVGDLIPNQWELTYVDHVPRGQLWDSPADWHKVFPGLLTDKASLGGCPLEYLGGERHYAIEASRGRIHVLLQSGRSADNSEILSVQTTARGPIRPETGWGLEDGLEMGHAAVSAAFREMASPEAHRAWGIEEG
jgi:uncharacterized protein (TIGR04255 family)